MPILNLKVSASPIAELSQALASGLVDITTRVLRKKPDLTAVTIDYTAPEHWIVGGRSLADLGQASFWLDIKVVDGTNTKDEKAAYVSEVFKLMGHLLDVSLHTESYVLVHEVPADAYGYGGATQEHRYVAGKLGTRVA